MTEETKSPVLTNEWQVLAKREMHTDSMWRWVPVAPFSNKDIELATDMARRNECFVVHKKIDNVYNLMAKINANQKREKYTPNRVPLIHKIYGS